MKEEPIGSVMAVGGIMAQLEETFTQAIGESYPGAKRRPK